MRPTHNQEVVFEGDLEARVAAQLLTDAGRPDLLDGITPPIDNPAIGRLEFITRLGQEEGGGGGGGTVEYTCPPTTSVAIVETLAEVAEVTPPGRPTRSRKKYMGQMLAGFLVKLDNMASQAQRPTVVEVGGMAVVCMGGDEQVAFLRRREAFVNQFLAGKGWDANNLSTEQLLEVRAQPGWQNP